METTALTSLPPETAPGTQTRPDAQPSGEFAKILQGKPAPAENPGGKTPEDQEGEAPSATGEEISVLLFSLWPALGPEGQSPSGGPTGSGAASPGAPNFGNGEAAQALAIPILDAGTKDGPAAAVQNEALDENPALPLEKAFNPEPSSIETSLTAGSPPEFPISGKGKEKSLPFEKARSNGPDPRFWHNPEGREEPGGDLKSLPKMELSNFDSGLWENGKDLFPKDLTPAEISNPGNSKSEGPFGNLAAAVEHSAGSRPAGEPRLEGAPGPGQPQKAEVYEQISRKMVWSLAQDEEKFRLTLDPPHLGSIYMEIQRDKEQVKATLWAENPNTRQLLESNQLSIQKIIEREGFSLESFNVFVEQDLGTFQESRERMGNPEPPASNPTAQAKSDLSSGPTALPLFVSGSGGRVRSIDLII